MDKFPAEIHIRLHDGSFAIVDAEDSDLVRGRHWSAIRSNGKIYAAHVAQIGGKTKTTYMHRLLCNVDCKMTVDHINGNSLDNRRANLRQATHSENMRNVGLTRANTSGAKGVHWLKAASKWQARIRHQGKRIHLGLFENLDDARAAYQSAAARLHGEFCRNE